MSVTKLVLGTAGLGGQPYGAEKRVVSRPAATALIVHALASGIKRFDTAPAYGDAESILGEALSGISAMVWTKTTGDVDVAIASGEALGISSKVYYLWHNWTRGIATPPWVSGLSVYAGDGHWNGGSQLMQQDWNLLQQWRAGSGPLMARSVFLQGRLTDESKATGVPYERARRMAALYGVDLTTLALRAAIESKETGLVVIGPTSMDELECCLAIAEMKPIGINAAHLALLQCDDLDVTDPRRWSTP